MILWFDYNVMDVVNVVMLYLVIISDAKNEFLPGDNNALLNWIELNWIELNWIKYIYGGEEARSGGRKLNVLRHWKKKNPNLVTDSCEHAN